MLSRRDCIARLAIIAGLVGLAQPGEAAEATGKVSKEAAKYQDTPWDGQMCAACKFYIPAGGRATSGPGVSPGMMGRNGGPGMMGQGSMTGRGNMGPGMMALGTCEIVEGRISPMAWCVLYRPSSG